jgi:hypothetical protein
MLTARSGAKSRSPESYASVQRRNEAAEILQSYEALSWWSFHRAEVRLLPARLPHESR